MLRVGMRRCAVLAPAASRPALVAPGPRVVGVKSFSRAPRPQAARMAQPQRRRYTNQFQSMRQQQRDNDAALYGLIGANVGVFMLWKTQNPFFMYKHFTCSWDGLARHQRWHTLATCVFSHTDFMHLGVNMIGLYFFGGAVLTSLGARTFLSLFMGSGVLASAAQVAHSYYERSRTVLYGASGAVNALIAFAILHNPRGTVLLYGILPVPMFLLGLFIMFQDVAGAVSSSAAPIVAGSAKVGYTSHLAGAATGVAAFFATGRRFRF